MGSRFNLDLADFLLLRFPREMCGQEREQEMGKWRLGGGQQGLLLLLVVQLGSPSLPLAISHTSCRGAS